MLLELLPYEVLATILSRLGLFDLAQLAAACCLLWCDAPTAPERRIGMVEAELRRRAEARRLVIGSSLPEGAASWVPYLLKRELRNARRRRAPLAVGCQHRVGLTRCQHRVFVDREGRLLTCGTENGTDGLGHDFGQEDQAGSTTIRTPILVPSMQNRRIVSVAAGYGNCLALSAEGEVFSWGCGLHGATGHGDEEKRMVPTRIEALERIERIAAGVNSSTSAAIDDRGRLFTWGLTTALAGQLSPTGLGYALDLETELTPRWVDALSQDRVVDVSLGDRFTLAVTDAGAVLSFGHGHCLGHGSMGSEVLPRRIEALAQTGRLFVMVAAGYEHALAVTEEGELYGWGARDGNGHWRDERTPKLVTTLVDERVELVYAGADRDKPYSFAVTETGELYAWGAGGAVWIFFGHEIGTTQVEPRRVERLGRVRIAAMAEGKSHLLVADEDGRVWACGRGITLGLEDAKGDVFEFVLDPTPIPNLRVRMTYAEAPEVGAT